MAGKTQQLQIRVSAAQKSALRARARAAGQDLSAYVLARVLPGAPEQFLQVLGALHAPGDRRYALAALHDILVRLTARTFDDAVVLAPGLASLAPLDANLVAAMVEERARQLGHAPPVWARWVAPLGEPWFASDLRSHRAHLLAASPVVFRRRYLFVDSTVGDRV
jgi:hypothetical protein